MFADARIVTAATLLTQLAGFGKTLLIAHLFGAAADLDGYYLALIIPSLLVGVITGSLQAGLVTVYVGLLEQSDTRSSTQLISQLGTLLVLLLGALCILLWIAAESVTGLLVLTNSPTLLTATASAFRVVVFVLLLNTVADYLALILNSHKRFSLAAISPVFNVLLSTIILAVWTNGGQEALTYGLLAGVALQIVLLYWGLKRLEIHLSFAWPRLTGNLSKVVSLATTMVAGILLVNLNLAVDQVMASMLGEGAVSIIGYANRFHGLIVQILVVGMGTVLLPHLAELLLSGRQEAIRDIYQRLAPPLVSASAIAPIVIVLLSAPVLVLLLGHGALSNANILTISTTWFWYSIGLLPMAWGIFLARYFQATSNLGFITRLATVSVIANIIFNLLLIGPLGLSGLAISTTLVYVVVAWLYHRRFVAETNFKLRNVAAKSLGLLAAVAFFLAWALPPEINVAHWGPILGGAALSLAAIYLAFRRYKKTPMIETLPNTTVPCPVCGSPEHRRLFDTKDYKNRVSESLFTVSRCLNCGVGYLSTRPTEAALEEYYDEAFYWSFENDALAMSDAEQVLQSRRQQIDAKAHWLSSLPPGRLLDIGTQKGEFIHHMQQCGWDTEGIEFSTTPPNLFDMPIRYGEFLEMPFDAELQYDCITMWAVLEHVYEPARYVARIAQLLRPGGRFIFLVTNFNTAQGRLFEMDDFPRHLNLFTKRSLNELLQKNGLQPVRRSTDQRIFGGHLQGGLIYLAKRLGGYSRSAAMLEWKHPETLVPFFHQWRGKPRLAMRVLSRFDRALLAPIEWLLDRLGFGFIMTIESEKVQP